MNKARVEPDRAEGSRKGWDVTYVIAQPCVDIKDKACIEECPVDCIYEGERSLYIHPDECVDCGACEPVCPVEAIYYEDDVPEEWADYYKANVEFFNEIGSPGGAAKVGSTGTDHPYISALPPQNQGSSPVPGAKRGFSLELPEYPWEAVAPYAERARQHPDGIVDLSIGTPVDPTPQLIQDALRSATDAHGYPTTQGREPLRQAVVGWFARRRGVAGLSPEQILPTIGSKELVAWLPLLLGLGEGDVVVRPKIAYPTYDMGALLAGATPVAADSLAELDADTLSRVRLIWLNSPGNPTGEVLSTTQMAEVVAQARELGAVVASDECYAELGWGEWEDGVPCILSQEVSAGSSQGLLAIYSLSKQSNLAGYRAAFAAGDADLIENLLNSRKHAGMIVPWPVQEAMRVALGDDAHVQVQKDLYRARRAALKPALEGFGLQIHGSEAGLYLWAKPVGAHANDDSWATVGRFADRGILVGPGVFYGEAGTGFVRVSLTGTDERITAAVQRLSQEIPEFSTSN